MTRIQRARALRLGFILVSLLCASVASARPQDVPGAGFDPKLDACWASGPATPEHLGPCLGMSAAEIGAKPVRGSDDCIATSPEGVCLSAARAARCYAKASLDYELANIILVEGGGPVDEDRKPGAAAELNLPDPDAAWENSYAACVEGAP